MDHALEQNKQANIYILFYLNMHMFQSIYFSMPTASAFEEYAYA